jgi:cytochrome c oxidase cbb3-type subunit III
VTRKRDELLDHDADGIREFDNDLPKWWLYGFYFTIVFGVLYAVNYHVLASPFMGKRTVVDEYAAEMAAAEAARPARPTGLSTALVALTDADSVAKGKAIYESPTHPCVACHRADLGGLVGPDLTDRYWLHGCSVSAVVQTIKAGVLIRGMLPYGGGPALTDDELLQVASYVLSAQGTNPKDPKARDPERDVLCE